VWTAAWSQQLDPELANAVKAHQSGDMGTAIREYRAYLVKKPQSLEARSNLGAALAREGRFEEAITEYKAALKLAPSNPGVSFNLALAYYKTGDLTTAARELAALRALVGDQPQVTLLLSDTYLQLGENAKVISLLSGPAKEKPDDLAIAYLLGSALIRENRIEDGQQYLDRILKNGDSAESRLMLGMAKFNASDFTAAIEDFRKAIELNPELPVANSYHGQALMATGDTSAAAKAFLAELKLNPNDYNSNLNLAVIRKQDRLFEEAGALLTRALRVRPGDLRVRYQMATIQIAQGKVDQARKELESVVSEAPKFTEAHVSLATVYYRLKRKEDGDRERAIVQKLNAEAQAIQPKGDVSRGEAPAAAARP
jgi:Flp pilus assembly protein TadD